MGLRPKATETPTRASWETLRRLSGNTVGLRPKAPETPTRASRETLGRHSENTRETPWAGLRPRAPETPTRASPETLGRHSGDTIGLRPKAPETLTRASPETLGRHLGDTRDTLGRHRAPPTQGPGDNDQSLSRDIRETPPGDTAGPRRGGGGRHLNQKNYILILQSH